jgi:uncharacterized membrane protein YqjE
MPRPERGSDPPLQETLADLWDHLSKLVQQEIALAKAEVGEKAQRLKTELLSSVAGAALLLAGLLALVAAVILLLAHVMPAWIAALITGAVVGGVGYALLARQRPSAAQVVPERTLQNLKKDVQTFTEAGR